MRRELALAVLGAAVLAVADGFLLVGATHHGPSALDAEPTGPQVEMHASGRSATVRSSGSHPPQAPVVPERARTVALAYATAAFSTVTGQPSDAWIGVVSHLCAPRWRTHLAEAENAITPASATVRPVIVASFGSWAPSGAVGVTVVVDARGALESLYVELRDVDGSFLVEATQ